MTFHQLAAWNTRFVKVLRGTSEFNQENTENRMRCNTGGEIKQDLVEYK